MKKQLRIIILLLLSLSINIFISILILMVGWGLQPKKSWWLIISYYLIGNLTAKGFARLATDSKPTEVPADQYEKCRHCGRKASPWFSRVVPMGYFCEICGGPWTESDGVDMMQSDEE